MQVEIELLLALLRWPLTESIKPRIFELLADGIDWNAFVAKALQWRVEAVAFGNLRMHFADALPELVLEGLAKLERESRARTLAQTLVFMDLLRRFEEKGIDAIVLKGPAIGLAAYGDVTLRAYGDMDLLVRKEALGASRDLLVELGYAPLYDSNSEARLVRDQHALEFMNRTSKVELHWNLMEWHLAVPTDVDELWRSAVFVECAGSRMKTLSLSNQFLFACAHGAKHRWLAVRWIMDIADLAAGTSDSDFHAIVDLAARWRCTRIVRLALSLAAEVVGSSRSGMFSALFRPTRSTSSLVQTALIQLDLRAPSERRIASWPGANTADLIFWINAREFRRDQALILARAIVLRLR